MQDNILNTKSYRMLCAMLNLKKRNADTIVNIFALGDYSISKSRAMNLLSQDLSMSSEELYSFIAGIKKEGLIKVGEK